ncbi:MAG: monovalent cation/H(+) antiporter subunit G [Aquihabitans sp.]
MTETIVDVLVIIGAVFVMIAGLGALRLHDVYARMHAITKASTIAVVLIGAAGTISLDDGRWKVALAALLLFITAPSAAHLIGRAAYGAEGIDLRIDGADDLAVALGEEGHERADTDSDDDGG